ncbi:hypothetical protein [Mucilaginibacter glaciei]|uniref:Uncharacterized protein n=1 Tax=Mucilaginibacter glaciei TaxID=2772109 RepID=A0A926NZ54_9SPHI|nr:hypothetical protein [Mucilaginibacter glaciei]MBD1394339.1 hypothetical protein [Mucilaginibacter glaciei]
MTFEEFFKKKRIDLVALRSREPGLYSEFEKHFNQMGEKSFDHTKKYWFNKLRLLYHLAPELKPEKVHIENQLAEQTITESLLEEKIAAPSVGFKPRFKAGVAKVDEVKEVSESEQAPPKPAGFTSRFKAGVTKPKPVDEVKEVEEAAGSEQASPKPAGFIPRFKAGVTKPKPVDEAKEVEEIKKVEEAAGSEQSTPKPAGFTPRFKAGITKTAPVAVDTPTADSETVNTETESPVEAAPKPTGFKPRFNMKMVAPKPTEYLTAGQTEDTPAEPVDKEQTPEEDKPAEVSAAKPAGFKPRFNAKMMKPKPPEEEK